MTPLKTTLGCLKIVTNYPRNYSHTSHFPLFGSAGALLIVVPLLFLPTHLLFVLFVSVPLFRFIAFPDIMPHLDRQLLARKYPKVPPSPRGTAYRSFLVTVALLL